jgi:sigma-B regulation protein RsbU (phosphoserine phosphatase)
MAGIDELKLKLLVILAAFALVPMISLGVISLIEMNQAYEDVQSNISGLSTSLNRSALTVAPNDADQVQLAIAKARQYDEFFKHIVSENELIANYAAMGGENESCTAPPGIWLAPIGSNQTTSMKRSATIRSLCAPARIMQSFLQAEPSLSLSYIGTEDGVLITRPYSNETIGNTAPFGYRDMPYYAAVKTKKETIWTGPHLDGKSQPAITITTPIYRGDEFGGIAGMDISLQSIYEDMSSMKGRGLPFLVDGTGHIVFRPKVKPEGILQDVFESDNLSDSDDIGARMLAEGMLRGNSGSIVIGQGDADGYVAFSPVTTLGWSFGIAYPVEEMSLPARFIDSGIKDVAKSATRGLNDALRKTQSYALLIFAITFFIVLIGVFLLSRRIDGQIKSLSSAAEMISRGDFDVKAKTSGEMAALGIAFNEMAHGLKNYVARLEEEAAMRGGYGKETAFLKGVKQNLVPAAIPVVEGYEITVLYLPSEKNRFDLYDIVRSDEKIALAMAGVGGDGIQAAMFAIMSRTLIRALPNKSDPSMAISDLNSQINQLAQGMNLACFYALLDPVNHTLEFVNSGFNPPFIVDPGGMVDTLGGGGIALGMLDRIELHKESIPIQSGDVMVMYSNGVIEAENGYTKQFGIEQLINLVIGNRSLPAYKIVEAIATELKEYSKNKQENADITLVILKRS